MVSPTDGWAVGGSNQLLHWDGLAWNPVQGGFDWSYDVEMLSATDGWIVGGEWDPYYVGDPIIARWNGSTWSRLANIPGSTLRSVSMVSPSDGWAVGHGGTILHWDGVTWTQVARQDYIE